MSESILRNSGLTQVEGGGWGQFCEKISSIYTEVRPLPYHASRCHGWETTLAVRGLSRPHHCFFFEWVSSAQIISIGRLLPRYLRHGCPDRQAIPVTGEDTYLLTLLTSQSRDRVDRVRVVPSNAPLGRGIRFQNHSILVAQGFEPGFNTKSGDVLARCAIDTQSCFVAKVSFVHSPTMKRTINRSWSPLLRSTSMGWNPLSLVVPSLRVMLLLRWHRSSLPRRSRLARTL